MRDRHEKGLPPKNIFPQSDPLDAFKIDEIPNANPPNTMKDNTNDNSNKNSNTSNHDSDKSTSNNGTINTGNTPIPPPNNSTKA